MALIERFWVVAESFDVTSGAEIVEGMLVSLDATTGKVRLPALATSFIVGIAGDTKSTSTVGIPQISGTNTFVNRVSDSYDETKASGKITVYKNGGSFTTNQYDSGNIGTTVGVPLYANTSGKFTTVNGGGQIVAYLTKAPYALGSGVPGTDTTDNDITLGNYIDVTLAV